MVYFVLRHARRQAAQLHFKWLPVGREPFQRNAHIAFNNGGLAGERQAPFGAARGAAAALCYFRIDQRDAQFGDVDNDNPIGRPDLVSGQARPAILAYDTPHIFDKAIDVVPGSNRAANVIDKAVF